MVLSAGGSSAMMAEPKSSDLLLMLAEGCYHPRVRGVITQGCHLGQDDGVRLYCPMELGCQFASVCHPVQGLAVEDKQK